MALLGMLACLVGSSCRGDPDEQEIRALIEDSRAAAEQKAFMAALAPVASDYVDNQGHNRDNLEPTLEGLFRGYDRLAISLRISRIDKRIDAATVFAKISVKGVRGGAQERIFGSALGGDDLQLELRKRSEGWRIVGAAINQPR